MLARKEVWILPCIIVKIKIICETRIQWVSGMNTLVVGTLERNWSIVPRIAFALTEIVIPSTFHESEFTIAVSNSLPGDLDAAKQAKIVSKTSQIHRHTSNQDSINWIWTFFFWDSLRLCSEAFDVAGEDLIDLKLWKAITLPDATMFFVLAFFKICVANFTLQSTIMGLGLQFFSLMRMDLQWCCWFLCRSLVHLIRAESTVMIPNLLILSQPCCSFHYFLVNFDFWHFPRLLLWNSRLPYALVASCWSLWPKKDEITWVHDFLRLINFQICLSFGYIVNCRLSPNSNNS